MAKLGEAFVDIIGNESPLVKSLSNAKAKVSAATKAMAARMRKIGQGFQTLGKSFSTWVTLPIVAGLAIATKAYTTQEDAENKLQAALAQTGDATQENIDRLKEYAAGLQQVTIFGDEAIIEQMAFAKNLGVTTDKLEAAAKAAIGLAAKFNIDLKTAMMLVGRAAGGNVSMLTRYGITLDKTLSPAEKFNKLLEIGAGAFGLAEASAKTTSGQLIQMKNAIGDTAEEIGKVLAPTIKDIAKSLKGAAEWFSSLSDSTKNTIVTIAVFAAALGPVLFILGKIITTMAIVKLSGITMAGTFATMGPIMVGAAGIAAAAMIFMKIRANQAAEAIKGIKKGMEEMNIAMGELGAKGGLKTLNLTIRNLEAQITRLRKRLKEAGTFEFTAGATAQLEELERQLSEAQRMRRQAISEIEQKEKEITTQKEKQLELEGKLSGLRALFTGVAEAAAQGNIKPQLGGGGGTGDPGLAREMFNLTKKNMDVNSAAYKILQERLGNMA